MKKLLLLIALLVIAAVASPFFIGSQIEKTVREQVERTNIQLTKSMKSSPQIKEMSLKIESYEKGYMDSKARSLMSVSVNLPGNSESKVFNIPFNTTIKHGPYLGDAGFGAAKLVSHPDLSDLELPEGINEAISNETFTIENVVSFSGEVDQKATIAPIKHEADGAVFDFDGATITANTTLKNHTNFSGVVDIQQLMIGENTENQFVLKPFKIDMEGKGDEGLMVGDYKLESGVVEATVGKDVNIVMQSMLVEGTYEQAKGIEMMLSSGKGLFKDITFINEELFEEPIKLPELEVSTTMSQPDGTDLDVSVKYSATLDSTLMSLMQSPVDVKTADIEIQFKGLPIEGLEKYQNLLDEVSSEGNEEIIQEEALSIAKMLVKNASVMRVELHAKSDDGDLNADLDAGFKPGTNLSEQELVMLMSSPDPQKILSILVGRAHLDLSKGVTDKAGLTPMVQMMAADFIALEGDTFKSDVQITDGRILINGTPLPFFASPADRGEAVSAPEEVDEGMRASEIDAEQTVAE